MNAVVWTGLGTWVYAYAGYPAVLQMIAATRARTVAESPPAVLPFVSITVPAYNESGAISETLQAILASDYPRDRRQILVISDASTDGTDDIVRQFAPEGVELLRLPQRGGKTAAENAAQALLRGSIVVNTDASVRIHPGSISHLVAAFADATVGVASSRDVSVARFDTAANPGESAYVGYEMWVRGLETHVNGIVGASGSLFAIRAELHRDPLPESLSRDFAAALRARERGFRAVSVPEAICYVPRGVSLHQEYRRKVRTMARGLRTLFYSRKLMNPLRYGVFAWMLLSHKLVRWLLPWASLAMGVSLAVSATHSPIARLLVAAGVSTGVLAAIGWYWPEGRAMPRIISMPAFSVAGVIAGLHAWAWFLAGKHSATWEPTRRGVVVAG